MQTLGDFWVCVYVCARVCVWPDLIPQFDRGGKRLMCNDLKGIFISIS